MKPSTLNTLRKLVKVTSDGEEAKREQRLLTLLRSPDEADDRWAMHVPGAFNNALDIRRTVRVGSPGPVWTQGSDFSFKVGDTLYDTPLAHQVWADALQQIRMCFEVVAASSVRQRWRESNIDPWVPRHPGSVTFKVMVPNEERTAITLLRTERVTQDEFVRLLISGLNE